MLVILNTRHGWQQTPARLPFVDDINDHSHLVPINNVTHHNVHHCDTVRYPRPSNMLPFRPGNQFIDWNAMGINRFPNSVGFDANEERSYVSRLTTTGMLRQPCCPHHG